jgi:hypothetical protein
MSFWMKAGISITDLECFKMQCAKHQVEYELNQDPNFRIQGLPVHAFLRDKVRTDMAGTEGFLVRDGGAFKLVVDNDQNFSSLTRDYTQDVLSMKIASNGGMVDYTEQMDDGSVVMKCTFV